MRNIVKKQRNQPCRSPSPDIANRSIIKNTTIQVQSIKSKMKQAEEKQLKFQLESSISQAAPSDLNSTFENKYKHLYDQYSRIKNQNKSLIEQNSFLNQENKRLSQYDQRNKTFNQLTGALLSKNQNDPFLKEKINSLNQSRHKLQNDLNLERDRNNQHLKEIENLRLQQQLLKEQLYRASRAQSYASEPAGLKEQQIKLTIFSNTLLNSLESQFRNRLVQLNNRINKIQVQQKIIKQQQYRLIGGESRFNKTPSSIRSSRKNIPSTGGKGQTKFKEMESSQYRSDRQIYPFASSSPAEGRPIEDSLENIQHQNNTFMEEIRIKNMQILRLKDEKQRLMTTLQQVQKDKKATQSTPKFRENFDDTIFKRMAALEANSKHLQQQCITLESNANHYQQQCNRLIKQMEKLKQKGEQYKNEKIQLLNFIEHQKKMMKCYETEIKDPKSCQFCRVKDLQIKQTNQKLKKLQQKYRQQYNQIVRKAQIDVENYQNRIKNSEFESNQKNVRMRKTNEDLVNEILNVKKMLEYIKDKFQVQDITQLLQQNFSFYHQIESTFYTERQEYDRVITNCRSQILFQEQEMARLQRESNLKAKQIQLLEIELSKVKEINKQLQINEMQKIKSNLSFVGREKIQSKSNTFIKNNSKILDKVKEGNDRLCILYQKVTNNINLQYTSSLY